MILLIKFEMPKYYFKERKRSKKGSFLSVFLFFILTPPIFVFYFHQLLSAPIIVKKIINPVKEVLGELISPIDGIAERNLYSKGGDYGVVIKNLKTGQTYYHNPDMVFKSASLYKLWVLAAAEQQIADKKLSEDTSLSGNLGKLTTTLQGEPITPTPEQKNDNEEEKKPETIGYKVGDAIFKMITVSDNYAAVLLSRKVGNKTIDQFLSNNFPNSSFGSPPMTTPRDIASYFEKLYQWQFINGDYSDKMLTILKAQALNDRIPKYLPKDIIVAHKTGELEGNKHDAGIVFTKNGDYIIVVMSKTDNEAVAAENIANFSKEVFAYESQR